MIVQLRFLVSRATHSTAYGFLNLCSQEDLALLDFAQRATGCARPWSSLHFFTEDAIGREGKALNYSVRDRPGVLITIFQNRTHAYFLNAATKLLAVFRRLPLTVESDARRAFVSCGKRAAVTIQTSQIRIRQARGLRAPVVGSTLG